VTSGALTGRTFFLRASIQLRRMPEVIADRVKTASFVCNGEATEALSAPGKGASSSLSLPETPGHPLAWIADSAERPALSRRRPCSWGQVEGWESRHTLCGKAHVQVSCKTISKQRQKKLCQHVWPNVSWCHPVLQVLGAGHRCWSTAGEPRPRSAQPCTSTGFCTALAAIFCCYSKQLRTGWYWGQIQDTGCYSEHGQPGYAEICCAHSPLPLYSSREAALANGSCQHSWCLAWLLGRFQHSLRPALQSHLLLLLPLQADCTPVPQHCGPHVINKPRRATTPAQGFHSLQLGISAQGGSRHSHPASLSAAAPCPRRAGHSRVSGSRSCAAPQIPSRPCRSGGQFLHRGHRPASTATRQDIRATSRHLWHPSERCRFSPEHTGHPRAALLAPLVRKGGLEKGWLCLPPPHSSPGNTSGSSRSARTNASSTAGGSGREGKRQEGNG